jgi:hypothetical protein
MTPSSAVGIPEQLADVRARTTTLEHGQDRIEKKIDRLEAWVVAALGGIALQLLVVILKG